MLIAVEGMAAITASATDAEDIIAFGKGIEELSGDLLGLWRLNGVCDGELLPHRFDDYRVVLRVDILIRGGCDLSVLEGIIHAGVLLHELGDLHGSLRSLQCIELFPLEVVLEDVEGFNKVLQAVVLLLLGLARVLIYLL